MLNSNNLATVGKNFVYFTIYTLVYFFLALQFVTDSGYSGIFFLSPLFPWVLITFAVVIISFSRNRGMKKAFVILMIVFYSLVLLGAINSEWSINFDRLRKTARVAPFWTSLTIAVFLGGQAWIWSLFYQNQKVVNK